MGRNLIGLMSIKELTFLPMPHVQGKKKKKQCRLKTTPFRPSFFFLFKRMKRRRFA